MSVSRLKLSANPLVARHPQKDDSFSDIENSRPSSGYKGGNHPTGGYHEPQDWTNDMDKLPEFQRYEETTNIELFYDLFFVANLTSFGSVHEINSKRTLTSYIGFFCVLWFTWCQVSMFDVRYVVDSLLERVAKACHLGIMVGLAVVGPNFDTLEEGSNTFRSMALILMVSRLVLSAQYLLILWHVRHYRNTSLPLALIAGANFVAAIIYLGVSFAFIDDKHSYAYRAFYVISVFEVTSNIIVSSRWKVCSFKGSHLVQRMSLLTLIILGEGVISVCKSLVRIVSNDHAWTPATIGTVISSVAIIYLSYMLYFDSLTREHFGSIRQQIWAFLHFPFHVALVLFLEGTSQFVVWHKMVETSNSLLSKFSDLETLSAPTSQANSAAAFSNFENSLNTTIQSIFNEYPPVDADIFSQVQEALVTIKEGFTAGNSTSFDDWQNGIQNLLATVVHSIFTTYGFEPAAEKTGSAPTPQEELAADNDTINLVGIYFFVTCGMTLLLIGLLSLLTVRNYKRGSGTFVRLGVFLFLGLGLALLATMVNTAAFDSFGVSAWILPLVVLCYGIALVIIHVFPKHDEES